MYTAAAPTRTTHAAAPRGVATNHTQTRSACARTRNQQLVQNIVRLVEVEYEVQLTHIAKVHVQRFYKEVDDLQYQQLIVAGINTGEKVEAGIALVHELEVTPFHKIAKLEWP
jgi:hypothetical protein